MGLVAAGTAAVDLLSAKTLTYHRVSIFQQPKEIHGQAGIVFYRLTDLSLPSLDFADSKAALEVPGFLDADCKLEKNPEGFAEIWLFFTLGGAVAGVDFTAAFVSTLAGCCRFPSRLVDFAGAAPDDALTAFDSFLTGCGDRLSIARGFLIPGTALEIREASTDGLAKALVLPSGFFCFELAAALDKIL